MSSPPAPVQPVPAPLRPGRRADIAITILLIVGVLGALVLFAILGILLDFLGADSPGDTAAAVQLAFQVFLGCAGAAVVGIVLSIIFLVLRRLAWWIALATLLVVILAGFAALANWDAVIG